MDERVFIALGSNLDQPVKQITQAIQQLDQHPYIKVVKSSSLYQNPALKHPDLSADDTHDYINAVVECSTSLEPEPLLDELHAIEQLHGRQRGAHRWQARTLDLDILLIGGRHISTQRLQIPHPRMLERAFVLFPLAEIAPHLRLTPTLMLTDQLDQMSAKALEIVHPPDTISL